MNPLHAVVYAKDLDRVAAFYAGVLDAPIIATEEGEFTTLGIGAAELSIVAIPSVVASSITIASPPVPREDVALELSWAVADFAAARAAAASLGGEVGNREWSWRGMVHCDGHDPEGNVFQLRTVADTQ